MLKAEVNAVYTAERVRSGVSKRGVYELVVIKASGNDPTQIPIWVKNIPCGVVEGGKFTIHAITGASIKNIPPSEKYERWQMQFGIDAYVTPV